MGDDMTKNLKTFESWNSKDDEIENLQELLNYNMDYIRQLFDERTMESDFLGISEPEEFVVEYWPKSLDGAIPKRISYYIDEIAEKISERMKNKIDWRFSPNGNVQRIIFELDSPVNTEHLELVRKFNKTKEKLRYT
jgi:hypothetical protein